MTRFSRYDVVFQVIIAWSSKLVNGHAENAAIRTHGSLTIHACQLPDIQPNNADASVFLTRFALFAHSNYSKKQWL